MSQNDEESVGKNPTVTYIVPFPPGPCSVNWPLISFWQAGGKESLKKLPSTTLKLGAEKQTHKRRRTGDNDDNDAAVSDVGSSEDDGGGLAVRWACLKKKKTVDDLDVSGADAKKNNSALPLFYNDDDFSATASTSAITLRRHALSHLDRVWQLRDVIGAAIDIVTAICRILQQRSRLLPHRTLHLAAHRPIYMPRLTAPDWLAAKCKAVPMITTAKLSAGKT
ncbi:hypothetical protein WOLCODRAFT_15559 [Wolfiporia cocos MD-104 SS10]|uniref:Uncharacterized protein n=1 Tax=Wolfiporia cocos (strain MD-104) TaxID=742152 RepID=A0A2H3JJM9_WOLCO|nr:hypothetical protein WOLCODRAFT_15559 [Wolfiporia cocos MD-104 SS10]